MSELMVKSIHVGAYTQISFSNGAISPLFLHQSLIHSLNPFSIKFQLFLPGFFFFLSVNCLSVFCGGFPTLILGAELFHNSLTLESSFN